MDHTHPGIGCSGAIEHLGDPGSCRGVVDDDVFPISEVLLTDRLKAFLEMVALGVEDCGQHRKSVVGRGSDIVRSVPAGTAADPACISLVSHHH